MDCTVRLTSGGYSSKQRLALACIFVYHGILGFVWLWSSVAMVVICTIDSDSKVTIDGNLYAMGSGEGFYIKGEGEVSPNHNVVSRRQF